MFYGAGEVLIRHVHVTWALQTKLGEFAYFTLLDDYYILDSWYLTRYGT